MLRREQNYYMMWWRIEPMCKLDRKAYNVKSRNKVCREPAGNSRRRKTKYGPTSVWKHSYFGSHIGKLLCNLFVVVLVLAVIYSYLGHLKNCSVIS